MIQAIAIREALKLWPWRLIVEAIIIGALCIALYTCKEQRDDCITAFDAHMEADKAADKALEAEAQAAEAKRKLADAQAGQVATEKANETKAADAAPLASAAERLRNPRASSACPAGVRITEAARVPSEKAAAAGDSGNGEEAYDEAFREAAVRDLHACSKALLIANGWNDYYDELLRRQSGQ